MRDGNIETFKNFKEHSVVREVTNNVGSLMLRVYDIKWDITSREENMTLNKGHNRDKYHQRFKEGFSFLSCK